MNLAPIILFVYNRPLHLQRTLESLGKNGLAPQSELIVYSDGPGTPEETGAVEEVRKMVHGVNGFHNIRIVERNENMGLSRSVVSGVT